MKGNDNSFYLNHNFEKKWNVAGWVFADYRNRFDETDKNIIIYGHNGKDGSLFGTLENVLKSRSVYDYGVEVSGEDSILTLSSCIGVGEKRVVLHAKLVKEEAKVISKNN